MSEARVIHCGALRTNGDFHVFRVRSWYQANGLGRVEWMRDKGSCCRKGSTCPALCSMRTCAYHVLNINRMWAGTGGRVWGTTSQLKEVWVSGVTLSPLMATCRTVNLSEPCLGVLSEPCLFSAVFLMFFLRNLLALFSVTYELLKMRKSYCIIFVTYLFLAKNWEFFEGKGR